MFRIAVLLAIGATVFSMHAVAQSRVLLSSVYEAGHFYATPELENGKIMRLLVDTGGAGGSGWYVVDPKTTQRLGLDVTTCVLDGEQLKIIKSPAFRSGKGLPPSPNTPCNSAALVSKGIGDTANGTDGVIGAGYLPGHIWTFDYPHRQWWLEPATWKASPGTHRAALGFQMNDSGGLGSGLARITLKVNGQPLDLLLDTGATAKPTAAGKLASGTPTEHGIGVTSYINTSVLNHWHQQHPDWRVVADGDDQLGSEYASRLIEVPKVEIAGWIVGPVWFTERPDANFSTAEGHMSSYMDKPVVGVAGGNIFDNFRMTIDYPARAAWFTCITQCTIASGK